MVPTIGCFSLGLAAEPTQFGRHAIAIAERRALFATNLSRKRQDSAVAHRPIHDLQVWLPGVHCHVCGCYPEVESGLSKLALEWIVNEATSSAVGLLVDPS